MNHSSDLVRLGVAAGAGNTTRPLTRNIRHHRMEGSMQPTQLCAVATCDRPVAARSMCLMHYKRSRTANNPAPRFSLARFDDHLNHDGPIQPHRPDLGQCWEWTGATNASGYGVMPKQLFGTRLAHRVALILKGGDLVSGFAMHECDNPKCCRPDHLREGTHSDNMADCSAKGRARGGRHDQTHCKHGHELSGENVRNVVRYDGHSERLCIKCRQEGSRALAARRKTDRVNRKKAI